MYFLSALNTEIKFWGFYRYEKTSQELTRLKTALNEKEMEVDDLKRRLKEANDQVCIYK